VKERISKRSRTHKLRLRGADGYDDLVANSSSISKAVDGATVEHLAHRYGGDARTVIAMVERDPELAQPLVPGLPYLAAEAVYSTRYEMARSVDDILSRRTRARLLGRDDSAKVAPAVAALVADDLGWDADEQERQVERYRTFVEHERTVAHLPETALDASLGA